jgi:hypothetical protein
MHELVSDHSQICHSQGRFQQAVGLAGMVRGLPEPDGSEHPLVPSVWVEVAVVEARLE